MGQKYGTYYPESGIVEWIVMSPQGYDEVTFVDEAQEGQTFVCDDLRVEVWTLDDKGQWDSTELAENQDVTCTEMLVEEMIYDVPGRKVGALIISTIVPEVVEVVENKAIVSVADQTDEPGAETIVADAGGEGYGDQIVTPSPTPTPSETPRVPGAVGDPGVTGTVGVAGVPRRFHRRRRPMRLRRRRRTTIRSRRGCPHGYQRSDDAGSGCPAGGRWSDCAHRRTQARMIA